MISSHVKISYLITFLFCPLNYIKICRCMIKTSSALLRSSSAIFGNLRKIFGNVRKMSGNGSSGLRNNFGKSSEIFGKWSEIFGKSSETARLYNKQNNAWTLGDIYRYVIGWLRGPYGEKLWPRSWNCCPRLQASCSIFKPEVTVFPYTDQP